MSPFLYPKDQNPRETLVTAPTFPQDPHKTAFPVTPAPGDTFLLKGVYAELYREQGQAESL